MRTGLGAIEKALQNTGGGSGGGPKGRYLTYFGLKDGESKVVRFLTDIGDLIACDFYEFVRDKNGKFQTFVVPASLHTEDPSWSGEDWVIKFGGKTTDYNTKALVDPTPKERIVGLAVEREEFPMDVGGRRVMRTQDKLDSFESREGKKFPTRNFMVVKQNAKFWNSLKAYYDEYGTICDRDYKITRNGTGFDISYSIIAKPQDEGWNLDGSSLASLRQRYGYGTGTDMDGNELSSESEDRFLYCSQTLTEWVENAASEERARAALVADVVDSPASEAPSWATSAPDEPQAQVAPPAASADTSSLRARLERHR